MELKHKRLQMCYEDNADVEEEAGCSTDLMKNAGRFDNWQ